MKWVFWLIMWGLAEAERQTTETRLDFFFNYRGSARNIGVNENIILRIHVILQIISSGF